jgi:hypothetical protein
MSDLGTGPIPQSVAERLWRNHKRYCGETIQIEDVLGECLSTGKAAGWRVESMLPGAIHGLPALVREPGTSVNADAIQRLYISAGIHGDEPASPLAALALLQQDAWPENLALYLCPCLNPDGFELNTRENPAGVDLNRQYRNPRALETVAHIRWLKQQPNFDLALCLHEDWESNGFYVYELNPQGLPSLAPKIIAAAETVCPIDRSNAIEGWPAKDGVIRPGVAPDARPDWPEAFYLLTNKTSRSYTLEAPSDYPLHIRTAALVEGAKAAADALK